MIALLLACSAEPPEIIEVDSSAVLMEVEIIEADPEAEVEAEIIEAAPEATDDDDDDGGEVEPEIIEDGATAELVWWSHLPPEERAAVELVNLAIDRLADDGKIKGHGVPWVAWGRDFLKIVFGLLITVVIARTRRPQVDTEAIASRVADVLPTVPASDSERVELARLTAAHRAALAELDHLRSKPAHPTSSKPAPLPGLEDPAALRRLVEERGADALRRRR